MAQDTPEKQLIAKLQEQLGFLSLLANSPSDPRFASKFSDVSDCWDRLRDAVSKSKSRDIGDFFEAIGSGVIEAQRKLDQRSEEYVRSLIPTKQDGTDTAVTPQAATLPSTASLFRIPRVSAELKCSLETTKGKSLNLIFYSDRNDVRELHQQTIQIEVVAVPVPPDYLNQLNQAQSEEEAEPEIVSTESEQKQTPSDSDRPIPFVLPDSEHPQGPLSELEPLSFSSPDTESVQSSTSVKSVKSVKSEESPDQATESALLSGLLVSRESQRSEVLSVVTGILNATAPDGESSKSASEDQAAARRFLLPWWSRTICLSDGHNTRYLLLAVDEKRPRLMLWQLTLRPASLRLLYKLPKQKQAQRDLQRLQRFLSSLGDQQSSDTER